MRTGFGANFYISFRRIEQDEKIPPSALHSLDEGETLATIKNEETIGQCPKDFSEERSFWIIETIQRRETSINNA